MNSPASHDIPQAVAQMGIGNLTTKFFGRLIDYVILFVYKKLRHLKLFFSSVNQLYSKVMQPKSFQTHFQL